MMKTLALVMRARVFYNFLFLCIMNNYSKITLIAVSYFDATPSEITGTLIHFE